MRDQKFPWNKRVVVKNSNSDLDGKKGTVIGMSARYAEMDVYILLMDEPIYNGASGLAITEHCLDPVAKVA